jgi:hypothetical protein
LFATILENEIQFVADLIVHSAGKADAARIGEAFEARGDVDAVAVDLGALGHYVAEIDADAEFHPAGRRQIRVGGFEGALNING